MNHVQIRLARRRLALGITNVGFWVLAACGGLWWLTIHERGAFTLRGDGLVLMAVVAVQAGFDFVGGFLLMPAPPAVDKSFPPGMDARRVGPYVGPRSDWLAELRESELAGRMHARHPADDGGVGVGAPMDAVCGRWCGHRRVFVQRGSSAHRRGGRPGVHGRNQRVGPTRDQPAARCLASGFARRGRGRRIPSPTLADRAPPAGPRPPVDPGMERAGSSRRNRSPSGWPGVPRRERCCSTPAG